MDILDALKHRDPSAPIGLEGNQIITASAFLAEVGRWSRFFRQLGSPKTVLYCQNRIRFCEALLGAWCARTLTVLPSDLTEATRTRLEAEGAYFVLDDSPCLAENRGDDVNTLTLSFNEILAELFTSGSTGEPTRVPKTLSQVLADIETLDSDFPIRPAEDAIVFSTVSHQHIYGFLWAALWPLATGRLITAHRLVFPENILQALKTHEKVILVTSPAHLKRLPTDLDWASANTHLDCLVSSGGPLNDEGLKLSSLAFGKTPFEILGSTELDGIAWRQRKINQDGTIDSVSTAWRAMPGTELSKNQEGILQVRSQRLDPLNWTLGNDLIETRPDGAFTLLGRTDRIVKIEEKRLSLTALEKACVKSGYLLEAKAFLLPKTQELAVVAVPSGSSRSLLKDKWQFIKAIERTLRKEFEPVLLPHRWRFEPVMPTNSQSKYTIESLAALFDSRHPEPADWDLSRNHLSLFFKAKGKMPYFDGYFPDWPIMPGVAQVQIAVEESARYLKTPLEVSSVTNLKFMAIIRPETELKLTVDFDPQTLRLHFSFNSPDGRTRYSTGTVHFLQKDA